MRIKIKDNQLFITTKVYQGRTGMVFLDFGNTVIKLDKDQANIVADDLRGTEFSEEDFNKYYG